MRIECPICEFQSDLDSTSDLSSPLTCGACHKTFSFSPELVVQPAQKIPPAAIVKPTFSKTLSAPDPQTETLSVADPKLGGEPAARQPHRRGQKRLKQAIVLGLLGLVALVLIGLLAFSGSIRETLTSYSENRTPAEEGQRPSEPGTEVRQAEPQDDRANEVTSPPGSSAMENQGLPETSAGEPAADTEVSIKKKKEPAIEYREPNPRILSRKAIDDTWLKVQPHLVELTAETAFGTNHATGILIDSRGWVLTSYRAIQGAREITVSQCRKAIEDPQAELTDLVRGVIASAPEHDLAILEVNRRFVTQFRDLPIVQEDLVVARQHLVQCASPSDEYPWPAVECPVQSRRTYEKFDQPQQQELDQLGYPENNTSWILHRVPSPRNRGAALINEKGELVGVTVQAFPANRSTDLCLATPAEFILALKQQASATSTPLPLPKLDPLGAHQLAEKDSPETPTEQAPVAEMDKPGELTVLPKESEWRDLSLELNRSGQTCSQFGWWPDDEDEAADLQQFADQLASIGRVIDEEQAADENEKTVLQGQIDYWWPQFSAGFQPADGLSEAAKVELNQRFAKGVKDESILNLVGFTKVHIPLSEGVIVNAESCITFQLEGTETLVTAVPDEAWPALRPGTACLIVAELQPGVLFITDPENQETEPSLMAKIHFLKPLTPQP